MIRIILQYLLLGCLLSLVGLGYFFGMTPEGLTLGIALLGPHIPGKLSIHEAHGILFSNFSLRDVTYQNADFKITAKSFTLNWNPSALWQKKFVINAATLDQANIIVFANNHNTNKPFDFNSLHWLRDIDIQRINLHDVNIQSPETSIHLNGALTKQWDLQWQVHIADLHHFVPTGFGTVNIDGNLRGPFLTPLFHVTTDATNIKINDHSLKKLSTITNGNVICNKKSISTQFSTLINQEYRVNTELTLPHFTNMTDLNQPLSGTVTWHLNDLKILAEWISAIQNPQGTLATTLIINGTMNKPVITGNLLLTNGSVVIPQIGCKVTNINVTGNSDQNNQIKIMGHLQAGSGTAQLHGNVLFNQAGVSLQLNAQGNDLTLVALPEYKIIASPDITLKYLKDNLAIQGKIIVPRADIMPKQYANSIALSPDVVFVGAKTAPVTLPFTLALLLDIQLGEKIHIEYNNLIADLSGKITLSELPGAQATAIGNLYTRSGSYTAYGQTLAIETGRLLYTGGALTDPGLDIVAMRHIQTANMIAGGSNFTNNTSTSQPSYATAVGVRVQGTLNTPAVTLFSVPPNLSQADILSYLILGYPQAQASSQQSAALLSVLSAMNPEATSFGGVTQKLEKTLGVSELNVESVQIFDPTSQKMASTTSLVVGKKLSPKLSLRYSVGLFNPVSILNLRYQMSKRWAIQSETSSIDNGADILYGIERD